MKAMEKEQEVIRQNLEEKGKFQGVYQIYLLFKEKSKRRKAKEVLEMLEKEYGKVDIVADVDSSLSTFAIHKYMVEFKDQKKMPAQLLMADFAPFDGNDIDRMQRSQLWDCPDGEILLNNCKYKLLISDFMSSGLPYKERCHLLTRWLEQMLELYPDCVAVWVPESGKLLTRQQVLQNPCKGDDRFIYWGVNARFFNVQGTDDMLVDTLGLYAIGLPDVQYHFHGLDPNAVVNHAYNVASYIFEKDVPVKAGETIDGLLEGQMNPGVQWKCCYELALIQPEREVMDICPNEYASGNREG